MFFYEGSSVDHGWNHLKTVEETLVNLASAYSHIEEANVDAIDVGTFIQSWEDAKTKLKLISVWDGDFIMNPHVFWTPNFASAELRWGFIFSQSNNGTTFVVSPVEMPHLEKLGTFLS